MRKLAIVVFADIAGYSALMQADERKALSTLDGFKTGLEEGIQQHGGEIIQYYGDGCLLTFESAFSSLQAAMTMQRQFIGQEVPVRIGIHLGDVVFKDGNVFGDGVNIASRVESLGIPGAILLSKTIRDQVKNKMEFDLAPLGAFQFKNIAEPMEVFAVSGPEFKVPRPEEIQGKLEDSAPPRPSPQDQREWERYQMLEILDALEEQKCVLILGNYAFSKPQPTPEQPDAEVFLPDLLLQEQHKWAGKNTAASPDDFYASAQLLVNQPGGQRMFRKLTKIQLHDLREKQLNRFKKISEIPFDLIVSTYPFPLLHDIFDANRIDHQFAYYSYLQESGPLAPFSDDRPLIYNLFGSEKNKESMVISLDRLYQFFFGILGVHQLPKLIQDKVQQASHLVFLGFSFDDWYMKLLLRVLKVHEKETSFANANQPLVLDRQNRTFFEHNFKMMFFDKEMDDFTSTLHQLCEEEGLLRHSTGTAITSVYDDLHNKVEQHQFQEVLHTLDDLLIENGQKGDYLKELSAYQQQFHRIKEGEDYGSYQPPELEKEWRQLRNKLSLFIDRISETIPA